MTVKLFESNCNNLLNINKRQNFLAFKGKEYYSEQARNAMEQAAQRAFWSSQDDLSLDSSCIGEDGLPLYSLLSEVNKEQPNKIVPLSTIAGYYMIDRTPPESKIASLPSDSRQKLIQTTRQNIERYNLEALADDYKNKPWGKIQKDENGYHQFG